MFVGRPLSEICRELAETASGAEHHLLAQLLRMAALQAAPTDLRHADEAPAREALVGVWDWDVANDRLYTDARLARMFGVSADEAAAGMPLHVWLDAIHPDDVASVSADIEYTLRGQLFSREYRLLRNGETRWVYARGRCTVDRHGRAVRFPGAIVDITQEKLGDDNLSIAPM